MRGNLLGAVAATVMLCGWATGAAAFQYKLSGTVTAADDNDGIDVSSLVGKPFEITVSSSGFPYAIGATQTDLTAAFDSAEASVGSAHGLYRAIYFGPSSITNDGTTSSLSINFGESFSQFGPVGTQLLHGQDGGVSLGVTSASANIPLDPEQSFGPIAVTGGGSISALQYSFDDAPSIGGYKVSFDITRLQGIASVSAVPLPASLPMMGAGLLGLAAVGYASRRRAAA